jgi:hypothetical protein
MLFNILELFGLGPLWAKIKFGDVVTDKRGKQGGTVYSRNKGGAYTRNKVTPSNPNTAAQTAVRSRLAGFSSGWRALTALQRQQWNDAVTNYPYTDVFGDTYFLSGQGLYNALNSSLIAAGASAITEPPAPGATVPLATVAITMAKGVPALSIAFTVSPIPAGQAIIVKATQGLSPGKNFVSSELSQITVMAAAQTTPFNGLAAYVAKYGAVPAAGMKVFFEFYAVNTLTGQQSARLQASVIVAA